MAEHNYELRQKPKPSERAIAAGINLRTDDKEYNTEQDKREAVIGNNETLSADIITPETETLNSRNIKPCSDSVNTGHQTMEVTSGLTSPPASSANTTNADDSNTSSQTTESNIHRPQDSEVMQMLMNIVSHMNEMKIDMNKMNADLRADLKVDMDKMDHKIEKRNADLRADMSKFSASIAEMRIEIKAEMVKTREDLKAEFNSCTNKVNFNMNDTNEARKADTDQSSIKLSETKTEIEADTDQMNEKVEIELCRGIKESPLIMEHRSRHEFETQVTRLDNEIHNISNAHENGQEDMKEKTTTAPISVIYIESTGYANETQRPKSTGREYNPRNNRKRHRRQHTAKQNDYLPGKKRHRDLQLPYNTRRSAQNHTKLPLSHQTNKNHKTYDKVMPTDKPPPQKVTMPGNPPAITNV